jgi:hypothetical protein
MGPGSCGGFRSSRGASAAHSLGDAACSASFEIARFA